MKLKHYLIFLGSITLLQGILGFIGISGPRPENSIFGNAWYFDTVENIAHTLFGIFGLLAGLKGDMRMRLCIHG